MFFQQINFKSFLLIPLLSGCRGALVFFMHFCIRNCVTAIFFTALLLGKSLHAECIEPSLQADGSYTSIENVELRLSGHLPITGGYKNSSILYQNLPFDINFGVSNESDVEAARNPVLTIIVPDGVSISQWQSNDGSQCNLQPGRVVCTLQDIGQSHSPENYRSIDFTAVSEFGGPIEFRASVSSDEVDHCASNNEETLTVSVVGAADLVELGINVNREMQVRTVETGEEVSLTATVTNNHKVNSAKSAYVDSIDIDEVSVEFVGGCLRSFPVDLGFGKTGQRCDLGDLPAGQTAEVILEVTATQNISALPVLTGTVLTVGSAGHDYYATNDEVTSLLAVQSTEIIPPPEQLGTSVTQGNGIDLEVSIADSNEVAHLIIGESAPLTIEVRNNNQVNIATDTVIGFTAPLIVSIGFSDQCDRWSVNSQSVRFVNIECGLGDILPGGSVMINTQVTGVDSPLASGGWPRAANFSPWVSANEVELDSTNNSDAMLYTVQQDPDVATPLIAPEPPIMSALPISSELSNSGDVNTEVSGGQGGGGPVSMLVLLWLSLLLLSQYIARNVSEDHVDTVDNMSKKSSLKPTKNLP